MWRGFDFSREGGNNACIITRRFPRLSNHRQLHITLLLLLIITLSPAFRVESDPGKIPGGSIRPRRMEENGEGVVIDGRRWRVVSLRLVEG